MNKIFNSINEAFERKFNLFDKKTDCSLTESISSKSLDEKLIIVAQAELKHALMTKCDEMMAQGINNIKQYEIAFQEVIESLYPDKSWWNITDCNIFMDLLETKDPYKVIDCIVDNLKPQANENNYTESVEDKDTKVSSPNKNLEQYDRTVAYALSQEENKNELSNILKSNNLEEMKKELVALLNSLTNISENTKQKAIKNINSVKSLSALYSTIGTYMTGEKVIKNESINQNSFEDFQQDLYNAIGRTCEKYRYRNVTAEDVQKELNNFIPFAQYDAENNGNLTFLFIESLTNAINSKVLDEAIPKDLAARFKKHGKEEPMKYDYDKWGKDYNYPYRIQYTDNDLSQDKLPPSGIVDYQNSNYTEITPDELRAKKKNKEDLSHAIVLDSNAGRSGEYLGNYTRLDKSGNPTPHSAKRRGLRANQSLEKTLADDGWGPKKIYWADEPDLAETDPEKAKTRLANREERDANLKLGHTRDNYLKDRNTDYRDRLNRVISKPNTEVQKAIDAYEEGDISRKEMERRIADARAKVAGPSSWEVSMLRDSGRSYQSARDRAAKNRYVASNRDAQKNIKQLKSLNSDLYYAKRKKSEVERKLDDAEKGYTNDRWNASEVTNKRTLLAKNKAELEKLNARIAELQADIKQLEAETSEDVINKDLLNIHDELIKSQDNIDTLNDRKDKLIHRRKK